MLRSVLASGFTAVSAWFHALGPDDTVVDRFGDDEHETRGPFGMQDATHRFGTDQPGIVNQRGAGPSVAVAVQEAGVYSDPEPQPIIDPPAS
jgi:hypothetical protein